MAIELLFLGTGTSAGVPMIGCDCAVCTSDDPRDRRDRPSVLVRYNGPVDDTATTNAATVCQYLIDTTPDLRQQCIRYGISRIDGVLYTHNHADHVLGIDDLRRFNAVMDAPLNIYAEPRVLESLYTMFAYIFRSEHNVNASFVAKLIPNLLEPDQPLELQGSKWTPLRLMHGRLPIVGFKVEHAGHSLAYCTDVSTIPPQTYPHLQNLDLLVLDALRFRHHPTHMTIERALDMVEELQPRQTYFTHMAHDVKHAEVDPTLPDGVNLAYDGLVVRLPGE